nr:oxygen-dependent choline dehydrogenase-like [Nerophis lumbriciformis]
MKPESYDYVICGAGSAGCVLANKLSADPHNRVLLLEAGPMDRNLMIHIPAGVYSAYKNPRINWNYKTEDEPQLDDRNIDMPRGKVIGGSSSINSMVYMRGHPANYDRWASEYGLDQWRFEHCLPYFKAGESSDRGEDEWRGADGPLGVSQCDLDNPLIDAFLASGEQAGQGRSEDLNGFQPEGVSRLDCTKRNGRRCSAAVAFLHPVMHRKNLTLKTGAMARRIVIEQGRAVGIEYQIKGAVHVALAEAEVVLSGGAINSPQLMMVSGIGPADHLRSVGIEPLIDLPGVGRNLQDHPTVIMQVASTKPVSIDWIETPHRKLMAGAQWMLTRKGVASSTIWEAGGFVFGNRAHRYPNLQYHFAPVGFRYEGNRMRLNQAFVIHIDQLRPTSRGRIDLKSSNPFDKPALHFNYLQTENDRRELIEGIKAARELIRQPAFDALRGAEILPGKGATSDADILAFIRSATETDYHPCATCRMGTDEMAVVDAELRVHGVEGLRVVDASVMPEIISANLNAPTQMIAARAADFVLGNQQRHPVSARYHFMER